MFVTLDCGDYWQCAYVIPKGGFDRLRAKGLEERREWPTKMMQRVQLLVHKRVISNVLAMTERPRPPFLVTLLNRFPFLRRFPARLVGMGFPPRACALT